MQILLLIIFSPIVLMGFVYQEAKDHFIMGKRFSNLFSELAKG